jgi:hypothetical protein
MHSPYVAANVNIVHSIPIDRTLRLGCNDESLFNSMYQPDESRNGVSTDPNAGFVGRLKCKEQKASAE